MCIGSLSRDDDIMNMHAMVIPLSTQINQLGIGRFWHFCAH